MTGPGTSVRLGTVDAMTNFDDLPQECDEPHEPELDRPGLSLLLEQQTALATAVGARLRSCDGTLRAAREWAQSTGVDWPRLRRELEDNGGYCDCEVVLNVFGGDFDWVSSTDGAEPD